MIFIFLLFIFIIYIYIYYNYIIKMNNKNIKNQDNILFKLVDNLNIKIKKLENYCKNKQSINKMNIISTYRISYPQITNKNSKKIVGLLFDQNFLKDLNSESDDVLSDSNKLSFIKLKKCNYIINYSITLKINTIIKESCIDTISTFSLGIRELNGNNKIKIIKGSKFQCDITLNTIDGYIIINNTIIYDSVDIQELCLITTLSKYCNIINKKSIIKVLTL